MFVLFVGSVLVVCGGDDVLASRLGGLFFLFFFFRGSGSFFIG